MHRSKGRVRPVIGAVMARDAVGSRSIAPLGLPMMPSLKFRDARGLLYRRVEWLARLRPGSLLGREPRFCERGQSLIRAGDILHRLLGNRIVQLKSGATRFL
jgi:hypothetical protein